jgi:ABC-type uncharacterized transport system substrate-binding protein
MRRTFIRLIFLMLFLMPGNPLFSHPHMFIDTEITFLFEASKLKGFWVEWYFDEIFTASIRLDYDADRNGEFDAREVGDIRDNAFVNLRHYHYFISIFHKNGVHQVVEVENFSARLEDNRLVYRFFVPFEREATAAGEDLKILVFDDTFFCDIVYLPENPIHVEGAAEAGVQVDTKVLINRDSGVEYDPIGGFGYTNTSGSNVVDGIAFPYELHLSFRKK